MHSVFSRCRRRSVRSVADSFVMPPTPPSFSTTLTQMGSIFSRKRVSFRWLVRIFPRALPLASLPFPLIFWPQTDYSFSRRHRDYFSQPAASPPPLFFSAGPPRMDWASSLQELLGLLHLSLQPERHPFFHLSSRACWPWAWTYCQTVTASIALCCYSRWQSPFWRKDYPPPCSNYLLANSKTSTYLAFGLWLSWVQMCSSTSQCPSRIKKQLRRRPCPTPSAPRAFPAASLRKWPASTACLWPVCRRRGRKGRLRHAYSWSSDVSRTCSRGFWRLFVLNSSFLFNFYGYF